MPYREKKIYTKKTLEVEIYPIYPWERKQSRKKKEKESLPKQKNLNDKNAKKRFIRLMNNNFTDKDLSVCLTYADGELPPNEKEARRDVVNYLRRIKHHIKKYGLPPLKYLAVIEYGGKNKRIHHHIVISGDIDRDTVERLWTKGYANSHRLQSNEFGYEGLARYITKDPHGNKRWIPSRNLKQPIVKVNDFKYTRKKVWQLSRNPEDRQAFEKMYPGYIFNSCKVEVNDINAGTYMYIKMHKGIDRGGDKFEGNTD